MCTLALPCLRELERRTGMRFDQLKPLLHPVHAALVEQEGVRLRQRGEWDTQAVRLPRTLGIDVGPRTWATHRA